MINLAKTIGRVMMTTVSLPRPLHEKQQAMETYVKTEFRQGDQAYVMDCLTYGRAIDRRNLV